MPKRGEHQKSREHAIDVEELPGVPDEVADTARRADELDPDDDDERDAKSYSEAGEDRRQRARQSDPPVKVEAARAKVLTRVDVDPRDADHAGDRREQDQE